MTRIGLRLLVASSLFLGSATAATRPHYGGTLRVLMRAAPASLDPAELQKAGPEGANLARLLFDTLVVLDDRGIAQPGLAMSWQTDSANSRWQFVLRHGVTFSEGTPLTAEIVAASLRVANPAWRVATDGDSVLIDSADGNFPAELSLPRNCVVRRDRGAIIGSGPFVAAHDLSGRKIILSAREDYWNGRPFVEKVEINLNTDPRAPVDWKNYHLAEMGAEQARKAGTGAMYSAPMELMALLFTHPASSEEARLREALSLSIDRKVLSDALLQGGGEPAHNLLPGWMTGYDFLFSAERNLFAAGQITREAKPGKGWTLGYDASDPMARLMAERIALNASDAGIKLSLSTGATSDVRLVKFAMASLDPHLSLAALAAEAGLIVPKFTGNSSEELYSDERTLLQTQRVIPLVHLKSSFSLADSVHRWSMSPAGEWHLADVWLEAEKP